MPSGADIFIRQAEPADTPVIEEMLVEAARWIDALGTVMWEQGELASSAIAADVNKGQFYVAEVAGVPAGAVRFQLRDTLFWPDLDGDESAFIHRLVVRRAFKGRGVSTALLRWAAAHARGLGKRYLRLDCDADRVKVRQLYEAFGFRLHSYRQVTSYYVARYEYPLVMKGTGTG
jgi:GNAT superfamily N-acetyltransferase